MSCRIHLSADLQGMFKISIPVNLILQLYRQSTNKLITDLHFDLLLNFRQLGLCLIHDDGLMIQLLFCDWKKILLVLKPAYSTVKTPNSSPVRARYGLSFVDSNSDLYLTSVTALLFAISCYIGPRYNGTQLYFRRISLLMMPWFHVSPVHQQQCYWPCRIENPCLLWERVFHLPRPYQFWEKIAKWHIYASVNYTIIGLDNGLSPIKHHQAIIWTNDDLLSLGPLLINSSKIGKPDTTIFTVKPLI